jgi:hypothetical protein
MPSPFGTVNAPKGQGSDVFAEPYLNSAVVATLDSGTIVLILCTTQGETVYNPVSRDTSNLWDKTKYGYIPDVNLDDDTTTPPVPVIPNC